MAALACDICGGPLTMDSSGEFAVCESCGMKHTKDRVKKMMIEGTVEVTGTVKVDNSAQIDNSLQLARRYLNEGNDESAEKYFEIVLQGNPNNWEAAFYSCYCHAKNCRIKDIGEVSSQLGNALPGVFQLIKNNVDGIEAQKDIVQKIAKETMELAELLFANALTEPKTLEDLRYQNEHIAELFNRYHPATRVFYTLGDTIADAYTNDSDMEQLAISAWEKGLKCHGKYVNGYGREVSQPMVAFYKTRIAEINTLAEMRKLQAQQERNRQYWEEHAEERKQYEARLESISSEIKVLMAQEDQYNARIAEIRKDLAQYIPAESQLAELKKQQRDLTNQKSQLGLFAGKQKKALQAQIDSLQTQINESEETVRRQKKAIQDDVNARVSAVEAEKKPVVNRIRTLDNERVKINTELSKDR